MTDERQILDPEAATATAEPPEEPRAAAERPPAREGSGATAGESEGADGAKGSRPTAAGGEPGAPAGGDPEVGSAVTAQAARETTQEAEEAEEAAEPHAPAVGEGEDATPAATALRAAEATGSIETVPAEEAAAEESPAVETAEAPQETAEAPLESPEIPQETAEAPQESPEAPQATAEAPQETVETAMATAEAPQESPEVPATAVAASQEALAVPAASAEAAHEAAEAPTASAAAASQEAVELPAVSAEVETAAPPTVAPAAAAEGEAPAPVAEGPAEAAEATAEESEEPDDPALAELREARESGRAVEGRVIGWNRGGFHVVVGPITAFCPASEMELGRPKSPASYMEKNLDFKVIKYQKRGRRVVLSRSAVLTEQRDEIVQGLQPGSVLKGRVSSLPDFGAFVDVGGVEGLVHVSEISRRRVQRPKDVLELGQEVEVKVLKVEQGGERISLSMKDLEPDPWKAVGQRFHRGDHFSGKVLRKTDFGLFVELEPEVEGLLHVSQLPPGKSADDPSLAPGEPVEGWIREVDAKRQRLSLSLREVPKDDPWREIGKSFPEGEVVEGTVESIAPFGVFVTLAAGVTGLLPNSQTGLPRGTNAARAFKPGQSVRVQVLQVDARRKRISLGREGSHVEGSKSDLQAYRKQQRELEQGTKTAMAAAFARLRDDRDEEEGR
jgi:small subunit ribosomal protein S1